LTQGCAVGNGLGSIVLRCARLAGTITDAVVEVLVCAVAANVAGRAAELAGGDVEHAGDAVASTRRQVIDVLSDGEGSAHGDEGK
jgi:hypothetical protein